VTDTTPGRREGSGSKVAVASAEQGRHWALFADWCIATDRQSLPATPDTLLAFLAELPVGAATVSRRVRAIHAAHSAAGLASPAAAVDLDAVLGRSAPGPRFAPGLVARALEVIPVGGWPAGIVGRRDAAVVALICDAGYTRARAQALHADPDPDPAARRPDPGGLAGRVRRGEDPGSCPACALSRWQRVAAGLERDGWRAVRAELADQGEVPAAEQTSHDCTAPIPWIPPARYPPPLLCAIDRHGVPQTGWPLSTRTLTAIVAARLAAADQAVADERPAAETSTNPDRPGGLSDRDWGLAQRRAADQRYQQIEAVLDDAEAQADAILARVQAAMGQQPPDP